MTASRLTRFVDLPGGIDIRTALMRAQANAEAYRGSAMELIDQAIDALMAAGEDVDASTAARLAESVRSLAGMFELVTLEQSAASLCDLIRALVERGAWDTRAVWVNIRALKIIRQHGDSENLQEVLEGLRRLGAKAAAARQP
ncbi:translation initiation factor 2B subunit (eIF-2B alpha/beta/delta family) [Caulobacter sp. BE264]|jgi:hypothetical protein|uniref:chemotaxis protein CheE n=1 Tax=Caulobacter sp. BE264 TaxID=2817724 RepID=UPI002866470D|nr:chemotaxis protein CheE [Caulobacter sp. BE264]MDR7231271.1 translation initiation factor 2B subunit (eIF-2B alpha/beta/delta family) [Caulobacter sp. BE264]